MTASKLAERSMITGAAPLPPFFVTMIFVSARRAHSGL
jgi:hypothetical protein